MCAYENAKIAAEIVAVQQHVSRFVNIVGVYRACGLSEGLGEREGRGLVRYHAPGKHALES